MKKQEIIIVIFAIVLIVTGVLFVLNTVKHSSDNSKSKDKAESQYLIEDDRYSEVVCSKSTNKNIYDKEVPFLNKTEYHIVYNDENVILTEYYQYYLVYPTEIEYQMNQNFNVEDEVGTVEHFDQQLTNLDTHYVIYPYIYSNGDSDKEVEKTYNDYPKELKKNYNDEVLKLQNQGYTCK